MNFMDVARQIQPLSDVHDHGQFSCGKPPLDDYIRKFAAQNQQLGYGRTYVAIRAGTNRVEGYYTISMSSVAFKELPPALARRSRRYPMPAAHLARLAVDESCQRQGLGEILLMSSIERMIAASEIVAARAIDVWAIDDEAKAWYERYGFVAFRDSPQHLFLPMDTARKLLKP
jgi:ribosomal protein S18 acetylase RimI-like enzyme